MSATGKQRTLLQQTVSPDCAKASQQQQQQKTGRKIVDTANSSNSSENKKLSASVSHRKRTRSVESASCVTEQTKSKKSGSSTSSSKVEKSSARHGEKKDRVGSKSASNSAICRQAKHQHEYLSTSVKSSAEGKTSMKLEMPAMPLLDKVQPVSSREAVSAIPELVRTDGHHPSDSAAKTRLKDYEDKKSRKASVSIPTERRQDQGKGHVQKHQKTDQIKTVWNKETNKRDKPSSVLPTQPGKSILKTSTMSPSQSHSAKASIVPAAKMNTTNSLKASTISAAESDTYAKTASSSSSSTAETRSTKSSRSSTVPNPETCTTKCIKSSKVCSAEATKSSKSSAGPIAEKDTTKSSKSTIVTNSIKSVKSASSSSALNKKSAQLSTVGAAPISIKKSADTLNISAARYKEEKSSKRSSVSADSVITSLTKPVTEPAVCRKSSSKFSASDKKISDKSKSSAAIVSSGKSSKPLTVSGQQLCASTPQSRSCKTSKTSTALSSQSSSDNLNKSCASFSTAHTKKPVVSDPSTISTDQANIINSLKVLYVVLDKASTDKKVQLAELAARSKKSHVSSAQSNKSHEFSSGYKVSKSSSSSVRTSTNKSSNSLHRVSKSENCIDFASESPGELVGQTRSTKPSKPAARNNAVNSSESVNVLPAEKCAAKISEPSVIPAAQSSNTGKSFKAATGVSVVETSTKSFKQLIVPTSMTNADESCKSLTALASQTRGEKPLESETVQTSQTSVTKSSKLLTLQTSQTSSVETSSKIAGKAVSGHHGLCSEGKSLDAQLSESYESKIPQVQPESTGLQGTTSLPLPGAHGTLSAVSSQIASPSARRGQTFISTSGVVSPSVMGKIHISQPPTIFSLQALSGERPGTNDKEEKESPVSVISVAEYTRKRLSLKEKTDDKKQSVPWKRAREQRLVHDLKEQTKEMGPSVKRYSGDEEIVSGRASKTENTPKSEKERDTIDNVSSSQNSFEAIFGETSGIQEDFDDGVSASNMVFRLSHLKSSRTACRASSADNVSTSPPQSVSLAPPDSESAMSLDTHAHTSEKTVAKKRKDVSCTHTPVEEMASQREEKATNMASQKEKATNMASQKEKATNMASQKEKVTNMASQKEKATNMASQKEKATNMASQKEKATNMASQKEKATNMASQKEKATNMASQKEKVTNMASQKEKATNMASQKEKLTNMASQKEKATNMASQREEKATNMASQKEKATNMASQKEKATNMVSQKEKATNMASQREEKATNMASQREEKATNMASQREEKATNMASQKEKATNMASQKEKATNMASQKEKATNMASQREEKATNMASQKEKATNMASQKEKATNMASQKEKATNMASQKEKATNMASQKEKVTNMASQKEKATNMASQKEKVNNMASQKEKATNMASQREEKATNMASQKEKATNMASQKEKATNMASQREEKATNVASQREEKATNVASQREEKATNMASQREEKATNMASQKEKATDMASQREEKATNMASQREEKATNMASQKEKATNMASQKEEKATNMASQREEKATSNVPMGVSLRVTGKRERGINSVHREDLGRHSQAEERDKRQVPHRQVKIQTEDRTIKPVFHKRVQTEGMATKDRKVQTEELVSKGVSHKYTQTYDRAIVKQTEENGASTTQIADSQTQTQERGEEDKASSTPNAMNTSDDTSGKCGRFNVLNSPIEQGECQLTLRVSPLTLTDVGKEDWQSLVSTAQYYDFSLRGQGPPASSSQQMGECGLYFGCLLQAKCAMSVLLQVPIFSKTMDIEITSQLPASASLDRLSVKVQIDMTATGTLTSQDTSTVQSTKEATKDRSVYISNLPDCVTREVLFVVFPAAYAIQEPKDGTSVLQFRSAQMAADTLNCYTRVSINSSQLHLTGEHSPDGQTAVGSSSTPGGEDPAAEGETTREASVLAAVAEPSTELVDNSERVDPACVKIVSSEVARQSSTKVVEAPTPSARKLHKLMEISTADETSTVTGDSSTTKRETKRPAVDQESAERPKKRRWSTDSDVAPKKSSISTRVDVTPLSAEVPKGSRDTRIKHHPKSSKRCEVASDTSSSAEVSKNSPQRDRKLKRGLETHSSSADVCKSPPQCDRKLTHGPQSNSTTALTEDTRIPGECLISKVSKVTKTSQAQADEEGEGKLIKESQWKCSSSSRPVAGQTSHHQTPSKPSGSTAMVTAESKSVDDATTKTAMVSTPVKITLDATVESGCAVTKKPKLKRRRFDEPPLLQPASSDDVPSHSARAPAESKFGGRQATKDQPLLQPAGSESGATFSSARVSPASTSGAKRVTTDQPQLPPACSDHETVCDSAAASSKIGGKRSREEQPLSKEPSDTPSPAEHLAVRRARLKQQGDGTSSAGCDSAAGSGRPPLASSATQKRELGPARGSLPAVHSASSAPLDEGVSLVTADETTDYQALQPQAWEEVSEQPDIYSSFRQSIKQYNSYVPDACTGSHQQRKDNNEESGGNNMDAIPVSLSIEEEQGLPGREASAKQTNKESDCQDNGVFEQMDTECLLTEAADPEVDGLALQGPCPEETCQHIVVSRELGEEGSRNTIGVMHGIDTGEWDGQCFQICSPHHIKDVDQQVTQTKVLLPRPTHPVQTTHVMSHLSSGEQNTTKGVSVTDISTNNIYIAPMRQVIASDSQDSQSDFESQSDGSPERKRCCVKQCQAGQKLSITFVNQTQVNTCRRNFHRTVTVKEDEDQECTKQPAAESPCEEIPPEIRDLREHLLYKTKYRSTVLRRVFSPTASNASNVPLLKESASLRTQRMDFSKDKCRSVTCQSKSARSNAVKSWPYECQGKKPRQVPSCSVQRLGPCEYDRDPYHREQSSGKKPTHDYQNPQEKEQECLLKPCSSTPVTSDSTVCCCIRGDDRSQESLSVQKIGKLCQCRCCQKSGELNQHRRHKSGSDIDGKTNLCTHYQDMDKEDSETEEDLSDENDIFASFRYCQNPCGEAQKAYRNPVVGKLRHCQNYSQQALDGNQQSRPNNHGSMRHSKAGKQGTLKSQGKVNDKGTGKFSLYRPCNSWAQCDPNREGYSVGSEEETRSGSHKHLQNSKPEHKKSTDSLNGKNASKPRPSSCTYQRNLENQDQSNYKETKRESSPVGSGLERMKRRKKESSSESDGEREFSAKESNRRRRHASAPDATQQSKKASDAEISSRYRRSSGRKITLKRKREFSSRTTKRHARALGSGATERDERESITTNIYGRKSSVEKYRKRKRKSSPVANFSLAVEDESYRKWCYSSPHTDASDRGNDQPISHTAVTSVRRHDRSHKKQSEHWQILPHKTSVESMTSGRDGLGRASPSFTESDDSTHYCQAVAQGDCTQYSRKQVNKVNPIEREHEGEMETGSRASEEAMELLVGKDVIHQVAPQTSTPHSRETNFPQGLTRSTLFSCSVTYPSFLAIDVPAVSAALSSLNGPTEPSADTHSGLCRPSEPSRKRRLGLSNLIYLSAPSTDDCAEPAELASPAIVSPDDSPNEDFCSLTGPAAINASNLIYLSAPSTYDNYALPAVLSSVARPSSGNVHGNLSNLTCPSVSDSVLPPFCMNYSSFSSVSGHSSRVDCPSSHVASTNLTYLPALPTRVSVWPDAFSGATYPMSLYSDWSSSDDVYEASSNLTSISTPSTHVSDLPAAISSVTYSLAKNVPCMTVPIVTASLAGCGSVTSCSHSALSSVPASTAVAFSRAEPGSGHVAVSSVGCSSTHSKPSVTRVGSPSSADLTAVASPVPLPLWSHVLGHESSVTSSSNTPDSTCGAGCLEPSPTAEGLSVVHPLLPSDVLFMTCTENRPTNLTTAVESSVAHPWSRDVPVTSSTESRLSAFTTVVSTLARRQSGDIPATSSTKNGHTDLTAVVSSVAPLASSVHVASSIENSHTDLTAVMSSVAPLASSVHVASSIENSHTDLTAVMSSVAPLASSVHVASSTENSHTDLTAVMSSVAPLASSVHVASSIENSHTDLTAVMSSVAPLASSVHVASSTENSHTDLTAVMSSVAPLASSVNVASSTENSHTDLTAVMSTVASLASSDHVASSTHSFSSALASGIPGLDLLLAATANLVPESDAPPPASLSQTSLFTAVPQEVKPGPSASLGSARHFPSGKKTVPPTESIWKLGRHHSAERKRGQGDAKRQQPGTGNTSSCRQSMGTGGTRYQIAGNSVADESSNSITIRAPGKKSHGMKDPGQSPAVAQTSPQSNMSRLLEARRIALELRALRDSLPPLPYTITKPGPPAQ